MKKILPVLFAIILLAACKKGTTITYTVVNHSGEQLTITSYYNYSSKGYNSAIVNNGETRDILILGNDGSFDKNYTAGKGIDSITGISNTEKVLTKNLVNASSWTKVTSKKQHLHSFTTEIKPADLK